MPAISSTASLVGQGMLGTRNHRHAGVDRRPAGGRLAAHQRDRVRRRTDERQAGVTAGGRELGVLGQKAVAGMDRVGAARPRRVDDPIDAEVAVRGGIAADRDGLVRHADVASGAITGGIHGDGGEAEIAAGAEDAHGNLAAIGDQNLAQG